MYCFCEWGSTECELHRNAQRVEIEEHLFVNFAAMSEGKQYQSRCDWVCVSCNLQLQKMS